MAAPLQNLAKESRLCTLVITCICILHVRSSDDVVDLSLPKHGERALIRGFVAANDFDETHTASISNTMLPIDMLQASAKVDHGGLSMYI